MANIRQIRLVTKRIHLLSSVRRPSRRPAAAVSCLSVGVTERPAKKAKAPRGKQGTPHPRVSAVQRAIDSADDLDLDSADDLDLSDLEAEGIPVEELLSPEAGAVDFGPRTDQEEQGDSDSDCNRRGADKNA